MRVLITGGSSGIGRSAAELFLSRGHEVIIIDAKKPSFDHKLFIMADISDASQVKLAADKIELEYGPLDGVYHNAAILGKVSDTLNYMDDEFMRVINVNLMGTFYVDKYFGYYMAKHGRGTIVNQSSILGLMPARGKSAYSASKAGVIALTKAMALELASSGVRVIAICPGIVKTPMVESDTSLVNADKVIPMGRLANPNEIAELAYFLITSESYMTGTCVIIDGGESAGFA